jgi:hypothetical protein
MKDDGQVCQFARQASASSKVVNTSRGGGAPCTSGMRPNTQCRNTYPAILLPDHPCMPAPVSLTLVDKTFYAYLPYRNPCGTKRLRTTPPPSTKHNRLDGTGSLHKDPHRIAADNECLHRHTHAHAHAHAHNNRTDRLYTTTMQSTARHCL